MFISCNLCFGSYTIDTFIFVRIQMVIWKRIWRLLVIDKEKSKCKVKCDCGNIKIVRTSNLYNNKTLSCWCLRKEILRSKTWKNSATYKHWSSGSKIYNIWSNMKYRCENKKSKDYVNYWKRGVKVSEKWGEFKNFLKDMWGTYKEWLTIERIDNDWNYCKENCRWASKKTQMRNTRKNVYVHWICCAEWDETLGLKPWTTARKIRNGFSFYDIVMETKN